MWGGERAPAATAVGDVDAAAEVAAAAAALPLAVSAPWVRGGRGEDASPPAVTADDMVRWWRCWLAEASNEAEWQQSHENPINHTIRQHASKHTVHGRDVRC